ncbi:thioredoxin-dependent thiol peroxidase [[Eubacterium] cellulosolvens]
MVKEGEKAPDFTLDSDDGKKISLSDFRGKNIVLYFYPKDGTLGCTQEAIEFQNLNRKFANLNAVILGISKDSMESHQKFKDKNNLHFILLSDPKSKVQKLYGVWKEKSLYGKKFMGTQRSTFLINEKGLIEKIYRKVKVKGHAQACLLEFNTNK